MELHCQTAKPQMAKRKFDEDFGLDEPKDPFLTVIVGTPALLWVLRSNLRSRRGHH